MRKIGLGALAIVLTGIAIVGGALTATSGRAAEGSNACPDGNAGLTLPRGFCASVFADGLGQPRQLTVGPDGTVYVNTAGRGPNSPANGVLLALRDTKGTGRADAVVAFGGSAKGGTGIALYKNWIYAETRDRIVRYALPAGQAVPNGELETVIWGLPLNGDHAMHPFAIDPNGNLFVDLGSATNSCQRDNRAEESPGLKPCDELKTRGGIWRYDANKTNQTFSPAERFATGLRNAEGIDFDSAGRIYATQHGRDQLFENWPALYNSERGTELPAEQMVLVREGGDYGWPYCYYDNDQQKLVLGPEYGGDGGEAVGLCNEKIAPLAGFPAHWAPNDLKIYKGTQFPKFYRGGAFIAFHGSWNRSTGPQGGFNVTFQPLAGGKAAGKYAIFADGFAGKMSETGRSDHRPTGLAVGPDGSLYVSDDGGGRIWRITYMGD